MVVLSVLEKNKTIVLVAYVFITIADILSGINWGPFY